MDGRYAPGLFLFAEANYSARMTHESYLQKILSELAETAEAMQDQRMSFIEGTRKITSLAAQADLRNDPDIVTLRMIDSETDTLPIGDVQPLWSRESLEKLAPEIAHAEAWARASGLTACQNLIKFRGRKA